MRASLSLWGLAALAGLVAGCPQQPGSSSGGGGSGTILTDLDDTWFVLSETGLINDCVMVQNDRVMRVGVCESTGRTVISSQPSVRSGDRVIWTFEVSTLEGGQERHTIAVTRQTDESLIGTYSIRLPDAVLALSDDIIMVPLDLRLLTKADNGAGVAGE